MIQTWQQRCEDHEGIVTEQMIRDRMQEEIDELRQALARPVDAVNISTERVDKTVKREHDRAVELAQAYERGWNAALAQTEQEPVGYINGMHGGYMVFTPINPSAVYLNGTALYTAPSKQEYQYEVVAEHANGTYTTKRIPKREWVGLTDEEVDECYYWKDRLWTTDELVRHVEAKLKEKNT